jgi:hypothetical protein
MSGENDKRLKNNGFFAASGGAQDGAIGGDVSPTENPETKILRNFLKHTLVTASFIFIFRGEEDISHSILTRLGKLELKITLGFALEETMGDTRHHTCSITVSSIGTYNGEVGGKGQ